MSTRCVVTPGICGMVATIEACKAGKRTMRFEVTCDCERAVGIGELSPVNLYDVLKPPIDSAVYRAASRKGVCASCPIPMAILKTIEVEAELALPKPMSITFEEVE
jgi:hypothetical protein